MDLKKSVKNWLVHSQKYLFTFSDGFYNLSYMMNSPKVMIECMDKLPFIKHNKEIKKICTNNPFCAGDIYYQDIEQGLMLLVTDVKFKANIKIKLIYDSFLPIEHYNLVLHIDQMKFPSNKIIETDLNYQNNFWSFIKPGSVEADYHLKGSHGKYISLHFTEQWIKNNIHSKEKMDCLNEFIQSKNKFNIWSDENLNLETIYKVFLDLISQNEFGGKIDTLKLKLKSYEFIDMFFSTILPRPEYKITTGNEFQKMLLAEKILLENMTDFIGIENLSKKISVSETKLKTDFKKAYGKSVYQYYKEKQMFLATEYLKKPETKIKDVALLLGYENPSKFTKAYKEQFGVLPSKIE